MRKFLLIIAAALSASQAFAGHRLTLQSGVPVTHADIASAPSVCIEPYKTPHNHLTTFDGTSWVSVDVPRATYCLSASGLTPNAIYDVLGSISGGIPVLSWSAAYTNDTTPPARAWQDGLEVLAADHTKLVIGTVKVNGIGTLSDSHSCRCLSNYYWPEPREMWAQDTAVTWNNSTSAGYTNATAYQQAHGNPANQLEYVAAVPRLVSVNVQVEVIAGSPAGGGYFLGIGLDGNSLGDVSNCGKQQASIPSALSTVSYPTSVCYIGTPGQGRHTVLWLEHIYAGVPPTWMGNVPPSQISGISGVVMN